MLYFLQDIFLHSCMKTKVTVTELKDIKQKLQQGQKLTQIVNLIYQEREQKICLNYNLGKGEQCLQHRNAMLSHSSSSSEEDGSVIQEGYEFVTQQDEEDNTFQLKHQKKQIIQSRKSDESNQSYISKSTIQSEFLSELDEKFELFEAGMTIQLNNFEEEQSQMYYQG